MAGLDDVGDASVYGTLRRLYQAGVLKSYVVASEEGPHRKYYGVTPVGRETLRDVGQEVAGLRGGHGRADRRRKEDGVSATMSDPAIEDADRYLKELTPYLAALPPDERADLLDDLAQHLREVAAEPGPPLAERLGSPRSYAGRAAGVGRRRGGQASPAPDPGPGRGPGHPCPRLMVGS